MATSSTLGLKVVRYSGSCEMFQINCVFYRPLNSKYAHCSKLKTMVNTLLEEVGKSSHPHSRLLGYKDNNPLFLHNKFGYACKATLLEGWKCSELFYSSKYMSLVDLLL